MAKLDRRLEAEACAETSRPWRRNTHWWLLAAGVLILRAAGVLPTAHPEAAPVRSSDADHGMRPSRSRGALLLAAMSMLSVGAGFLSGWIYDRATAPPDVAAVLARVEPSVVSVTATTQHLGKASGTGIIVGASGEVLTNYHVIETAATISVTYFGSTTAHRAKVVRTDRVADVALIKVLGARGLVPAPIASSNTLRVGNQVIAIGNALALRGGPSITEGIISALNRSIATTSRSMHGLIQTDAPISSGDSGGPLVNVDGQVVGIDTVAATSNASDVVENIGFAIPAASALREVRVTARERAQSSGDLTTFRERIHSC